MQFTTTAPGFSRAATRKAVAQTRAEGNGNGARMDPYKDRPSTKYNAHFRTTKAGAPVANDRNSLTVGERGPVLLEDFHLNEKTAQFNRERIPERVVHARGASAKGYFEVTHDVSQYTCASFLTGIGKSTPLIARFSTVTHERGSPEALRDPRGFAVKFYSEQGNWDFVGLNFPVFWIRDGMAFTDLNHALKPSPVTNVQEWWRIFDFLSFHPEACNVLTYLLDDAGIPADWRHMPGFGIHAFKFINAEGKETYAKMSWHPKGGEKHLVTDAEAIQVGGSNHSHASEALYTDIESGDYPEWQLFIQTIAPENEFDYDFDILDATKAWPEDIAPLQPVGKMVLNQNIDNFFNENEMLAFDPGVPLPGIDVSEDKLFQNRIHSYADTQRYRLGTNYTQLPVNAPKCPFHTGSAHDGHMNFTERTEPVNYFPSRFDKTVEAEHYYQNEKRLEGRRERKTIENEDNFSQPGAHWRSFDKERRMRFVERVSMKMTSKGMTPELQDIWIDNWKKCDQELGALVEEKVMATAAK